MRTGKFQMTKMMMTMEMTFSLDSFQNRGHLKKAVLTTRMTTTGV